MKEITRDGLYTGLLELYLVVITAILCDTVFNVEEKIEVFSVQIAQGLFAGDS